MPWPTPTVADFKAQFVRDFPYAPTLDSGNLDYVIDADIQNAINLALGNFTDLYGAGALTLQIFLYLAAHYMVTNIRNSSMGLGSLAKFITESSSVGGVSTTNNVSEIYGSNPLFANLLTTGYGKIYLDMAYPYTIGGGIGIACGRTTYA